MTRKKKAEVISLDGMVDVVSGTSQSWEEWAREVERQFRTKRLSRLVLNVKRNGECYFGGLYVTKDDFEKQY